MRIITIAAVAVMALSAQGVAGQSTPPRRQLVEELRLDANKEDFPALRQFSVGPRGQIAVVIDEDKQVRFYDSQGKKVGVLGRKGSGPGEFQDISARTGWVADTFWVYDFGLKRITFMSSEAKLIRSEVVTPKLNEGVSGRRSGPLEAGTVSMFVPAAVSPGGVITGPAMITVGLNATNTMETRSLVIATTADGANRKTVAIPPKTDNAMVSYQPGDGSAFSSAIPFVFSPRTEYASDGTRVAFLTADVSAKATTYTVTVLRLSVNRDQLALEVAGRADDANHGDTLYSRAYSVVSIPIPSSALDSAMNAVGARFPTATAEKLRERAREKAPTAYAPVSGLVLGVDNTSWVLLRRTAEGTPAVALDAKGMAITSILVPPKSRLIQASLARVWLLETDDDGLSSIVRYRLR